MQSLYILAQIMRMQQLTTDTALIDKRVGVTIMLLSLAIVRLHIILITYLRQL